MLEAILGDLLTEEFGKSDYLDPNPSQSHFGYPSDNPQMDP